MDKTSKTARKRPTSSRGSRSVAAKTAPAKSAEPAKPAKPAKSAAFGLEDRRAGARASDVNPAVYVADSEIHGLGMFATHAIEADLSLGRLAGMPTHEDGIYVLWLDDELGLEVTNDFRFINHDKDPNCELTDVDVVTLRPIAPDEELTHDYGW